MSYLIFYFDISSTNVLKIRKFYMMYKEFTTFKKYQTFWQKITPRKWRISTKINIFMTYGIVCHTNFTEYMQKIIRFLRSYENRIVSF